jgi:hypothetical protein
MDPRHDENMPIFRKKGRENQISTFCGEIFGKGHFCVFSLEELHKFVAYLYSTKECLRDYVSYKCICTELAIPDHTLQLRSRGCAGDVNNLLIAG